MPLRPDQVTPAQMAMYTSIKETDPVRATSYARSLGLSEADMFAYENSPQGNSDVKVGYFGSSGNFIPAGGDRTRLSKPLAALTGPSNANLQQVGGNQWWGSNPSESSGFVMPKDRFAGMEPGLADQFRNFDALNRSGDFDRAQVLLDPYRQDAARTPGGAEAFNAYVSNYMGLTPAAGGLSTMRQFYGGPGGATVINPATGLPVDPSTMPQTAPTPAVSPMSASPVSGGLSATTTPITTPTATSKPVVGTRNGNYEFGANGAWNLVGGQTPADVNMANAMSRPEYGEATKLVGGNGQAIYNTGANANNPALFSNNPTDYNAAGTMAARQNALKNTYLASGGLAQLRRK